jgi:hypothetical protein
MSPAGFEPAIPESERPLGSAAYAYNIYIYIYIPYMYNRAVCMYINVHKYLHPHWKALQPTTVFMVWLRARTTLYSDDEYRLCKIIVLNCFRIVNVSHFPGHNFAFSSVSVHPVCVCLPTVSLLCIFCYTLVTVMNLQVPLPQEVPWLCLICSYNNLLSYNGKQWRCLYGLLVLDNPTQVFTSGPVSTN